VFSFNFAQFVNRCIGMQVGRIEAGRQFAMRLFE